MSLIGCHGSVWTGTFDEVGLRRAVEGTARAGFDLIELPIFRPDEWDTKFTRSLLADNGLAATASLGLTDELNISSRDPAIVARGEDHLTKVIDVLAEIGGTQLVGVIYAAMKKNLEPASNEEIRNGQEALGRLSRYAAKAGITLGCEVVNRYETNIINTGREAQRYLNGINGQEVGLHLDTYHMNIEESDMWRPIVEGAKSLTYMHIGESHRGYLGTGSVDFDACFRALDHVNYDGPIVFESFSSVIVDAQMTAALAIWRNLWEDSLDLATHANRFIRDKIRAVETIAMH